MWQAPSAAEASGICLSTVGFVELLVCAGICTLPMPRTQKSTHISPPRERPVSDGKVDASTVIRPNGVLSQPTLVCLLILTALSVLGALYVGKDVILPVVLAVLLKLLLQPIVDFLCARLRVPPVASALILILLLFGSIAVIGFSISVPASGWIQKAPGVLPSLKEKLNVLRQPIDFMQRAFKEIEEVAAPGANDPNAPTVKVREQSAIAASLARGTLATVGRFFATMVILFFLLAAGDRLLRGFIEILPRISDKQQAVDIAFEIQRSIGGYLLTISVMNAVVGIVTGLAMWSSGLGDPILWGTMAFLLNYIPILGPLTGIGIFLVAGILALDWPWFALLPAFLYMLIHIAEGELVTPMLLARRFTLNPVVVIVSLFFWHALWGIPGALLAVPLLAMFKIVADRIEPLKPIGHVIGA
jgi:predicted PurR-regulated permease PerM